MMMRDRRNGVLHMRVLVVRDREHGVHLFLLLMYTWCVVLCIVISYVFV